MSDFLNAKLESVRQKHFTVIVADGVCRCLVIAAAALLVTCLLDWWLELPAWMRGLMLAGWLAGVGYVLVRHVVLPVRRGADDEQVALWVEKKTPGIASRLISTVQFTAQLTTLGGMPAGMSGPMVRAMIEETEEMSRRIDFGSVVATDGLFKHAGAATLAVVLFAGSLALAGGDGLQLLQRAFLVPGVDVPRQTSVELLTPVEILVARGEAVQLRARATGVVPTVGRLEMQREDGTTRSFIMPAETEAPDTFALTVDNVQEGFSYRVYLHDGRSEVGQVVSAVRPAATGVGVTQLLPAYTQEPPRARSVGDLTLLAGSRIQLEVRTNKPVAVSGNELRLAGSNRTFPLVRDPADASRLTLEQHAGGAGVPLSADVTGMSVHLIDEKGLTNVSPAVYLIRLVPDRPPAVEVTAPDRQDVLVTDRATVILGMTAADDFGLGDLTVQYRITRVGTTLDADNASEREPSTIRLALQGTPATFRGYYEWKLNEISDPPRVGDVIEWWVRAQDANDVTGPGVGESGRRLIRIGTTEEVRQDILMRLDQQLDEIDDVRGRQENLAEQLGDLILARPEGVDNE
ncbi:MAG: hypothetical protein ACFCVE_03155 [Phycisphaerae bacterium]